MRKRVSAPARLVDLPPEHALAELGVLVESVPAVPSAELPLVKWRVRGTLRRRVEWRRRALRVAVVGSLLFLAGGVVGAVVQPVWLWRLRMKLDSAVEPTRPAHAVSARGRRRAEAPVREVPPAPVPPEPESEVAATEVPTDVAAPPSLAAVSLEPPAATANASGKPPALVPSNRMVAANTPSARYVRPPSPRELPAIAATDATGRAPEPYLLSPPPPSVPAIQPVPQRSPAATPMPASAPPPRVSEQALLTKALRGLSIDRDPERALAALDEHARHFAAGALAPEAARLRAWALLLSGRREAALAELSRLSSEAGFDGLPAGEEYRLLRGELHAKAGHWRAALADFDFAVVACLAKESTSGAVDRTTRSRTERALWGRASARSHSGDLAGAEADLREYLRRFPQGRFAVPTTRLLKGGR